MTFSDDQIKRASDMSITAVVKQFYGDSLRKVSQDTYRIVGQNLGGLEINDRKNSWYNFAEAKGGVGGLNFLTNYLGIHFQTAMQHLGFRDQSEKQVAVENFPVHIVSNKPDEPQKVFTEPEHAENNRRLWAYFTNARGISSDIIYKLVKSGILFQDREHNNAVFLHKENGISVGAECHGTLSAGEKFKKNQGKGYVEYDGSPNPQTVFVFESAIDMMSFMCLHPEHLPQKFISMAGLKPSHLEAVADRNPNINICLCVDNDEAGEKFTKVIVHNFREDGRQNKILISSELRKRNVKDFNDLLKITRSEENTQKARTTKRTCAATDR